MTNMNELLLPQIRSESLPVPLLYAGNITKQETMIFNEFKVPEQGIALQVPQQPAVPNYHTAKRNNIAQGPRAMAYVSPEMPRNFYISSSGDGRQARRIGSEVRIVDGHQQNLY